MSTCFPTGNIKLFTFIGSKTRVFCIEDSLNQAVSSCYSCLFVLGFLGAVLQTGHYFSFEWKNVKILRKSAAFIFFLKRELV